MLKNMEYIIMHLKLIKSHNQVISYVSTQIEINY